MSLVRPGPFDSEIELLAEMVHSSGFAVFVQEVLVPRILGIRQELLGNENLPEYHRRGLVVALREFKNLLASTYEIAGDEQMPELYARLFR
jgi:hypothetical protein